MEFVYTCLLGENKKQKNSCKTITLHFAKITSRGQQMLNTQLKSDFKLCTCLLISTQLFIITVALFYFYKPNNNNIISLFIQLEHIEGKANQSKNSLLCNGYSANKADSDIQY